FIGSTTRRDCVCNQRTGAVRRNAGRSAGPRCGESGKPDFLGCESIRVQDGQDCRRPALLAPPRALVLYVGSGGRADRDRMADVSPKDYVVTGAERRKNVATAEGVNELEPGVFPSFEEGKKARTPTRSDLLKA